MNSGTKALPLLLLTLLTILWFVGLISRFATTAQTREPATFLPQRLRMAGQYCDSLPQPLRHGLLSLASHLGTSTSAAVPPTPELRAEAYAGLQRLSLCFLVISCLILGALVVAWESTQTGGLAGSARGGASPPNLGKATGLFLTWELGSRYLLLPLVGLAMPGPSWGKLFLGQTLSYLLLLALLMWAGQSLRPAARVDWAWAARGYLLCALGISLANGLVHLLCGVGPFLRNPTLGVFDAAPPHVLLPLTLWLVLVGPVMEELLYRGYLLKQLSARLGDTRGLLLTSLLFALAHGSVWNVPSLFVGGLALGWTARRSGSLASCMLAHSLWNLTWLAQAMAWLR